MATVDLEQLQQRLEQLEAEVAQMKAEKASGKDWRRSIGKFSGNEAMRAIDEAALRYREEDRAATRPAE